MKKIVDPSPAGWVYGFPKVVDDEATYMINPGKWLQDNGYPVDKYPYYVIRSWCIDD